MTLQGEVIVVVAVLFLSGWLLGLPGGTSGKEPACQCRRLKRLCFNLQIEIVPWRRAWQPTPLFLPGESHGRRSLVGYSPQAHTESDMTGKLACTGDYSVPIVESRTFQDIFQNKKFLRGFFCKEIYNAKVIEKPYLFTLVLHA